MASDGYLKAVLTVMAACLVVLVAQGFGVGSRVCGATAVGGAHKEGRYQIVPIPIARTLLRLDQATGKTWRSSLPKPMAWAEVDESAGPDSGADETEETPAPPAVPPSP